MRKKVRQNQEQDSASCASDWGTCWRQQRAGESDSRPPGSRTGGSRVLWRGRLWWRRPALCWGWRRWSPSSHPTCCPWCGWSAYSLDPLGQYPTNRLGMLRLQQRKRWGFYFDGSVKEHCVCVCVCVCMCVCVCVCSTYSLHYPPLHCCPPLWKLCFQDGGSLQQSAAQCPARQESSPRPTWPPKGWQRQHH